MVSLRLSPNSRGALKRVARITGWTKTHAMETAIKNLEIKIKQPAGQ